MRLKVVKFKNESLAACIILIWFSLCLCTIAQFLIRESHTGFFPPLELNFSQCTGGIMLT